jgi:hypothetical protein
MKGITGATRLLLPPLLLLLPLRERGTGSGYLTALCRPGLMRAPLYGSLHVSNTGLYSCAGGVEVGGGQREVGGGEE